MVLTEDEQKLKRWAEAFSQGEMVDPKATTILGLIRQKENWSYTAFIDELRATRVAATELLVELQRPKDLPSI